MEVAGPLLSRVVPDDKPCRREQGVTMSKKPKTDVADALEADGWLSPDTYGRDFSVPGDFPAVYLFMQVDFDLNLGRNYRREIAYIGMSTKLASRWATHETLRKIRAEGLWIKRMFKPTPKEMLREEERRYIQQFLPRWNVIGRIPGQ
jgi:hypothetical protein